MMKRCSDGKRTPTPGNRDGKKKRKRKIPTPSKMALWKFPYLGIHFRSIKRPKEKRRLMAKKRESDGRVIGSDMRNNRKRKNNDNPFKKNNGNLFVMLPPFGQRRLLRRFIMGRMIRFQMAGNPLMKGAIFISKGRDHILIGSSVVFFRRMIGGAVRAFRKLLRDPLIPLGADRLKVMPLFLHEDSPLHRFSRNPLLFFASARFLRLFLAAFFWKEKNQDQA